LRGAESMKKVVIAFSFLAVLVQCSPYNVKTQISDSSAIKSFQKAGVLFRILKTNDMPRRELESNFLTWLEPGKKNRDVMLVTDAADSVASVETDHDRFYQLSSSGSFLKYKSVGMVALYLRNNEEQLKKIMADNQLDGLIVYEIDAGFSTAMQFIDFNSTVVIVDSRLEIRHLDYQKKAFDIIEWDPEIIKKHLMDKVSHRLLDLLAGYKFIEAKL
jgi:hypothetical protein